MPAMVTTPISNLVSSLLEKRGIVGEEMLENFLNPDYEKHTHDPFLLNDMPQAVERVFQAMQENERIAVYADFDCDGIPGAAVLLNMFQKISYPHVEAYIPHRDREGYGFHIRAIDTLKAHSVSLIITVDVGTVAYEACAYARSLGIDVIVTDHHEIQNFEGVEKRPDVYALINPKIAPYPFGGLCGAGVAFKFAQALLHEGRERAHPSFVQIPTGWEKWLLDLVAIATVADMVPLLDENRTLVTWGLFVLRKSNRPGITALINRLRLRKHQITEDDIAFSFAPRINAASRMGDPELALKLLTTPSLDEAEALAAELDSLNNKRKTTVATIVKAARARAKERYAPEARAIVLGNPQWKPALLGLAANSVMDDFSGLVCLWGRDAEGKLKGSCRTDGSVDLMEVFEHARDIFDECGGHRSSGGFSISHEQVHRLPEVLEEAVALRAPGDGERQVIEADILASLREAHTLLRDLSRAAPFGVGNPKPTIRFPRVVVSSLKRFGSDSNHIELQLVEEVSSVRMRAFQFFKSELDFSHTPRMGEVIDLIATIERDTFRGQHAIALRIIDVLPA